MRPAIAGSGKCNRIAAHQASGPLPCKVRVNLAAVVPLNRWYALARGLKVRLGRVHRHP